MISVRINLYYKQKALLFSNLVKLTIFQVTLCVSWVYEKLHGYQYLTCLEKSETNHGYKTEYET